jgi:hypothetical protein
MPLMQCITHRPLPIWLCGKKNNLIEIVVFERFWLLSTIYPQWSHPWLTKLYKVTPMIFTSRFVEIFIDCRRLRLNTIILFVDIYGLNSIIKCKRKFLQIVGPRPTSGWGGCPARQIFGRHLQNINNSVTCGFPEYKGPETLK